MSCHVQCTYDSLIDCVKSCLLHMIRTNIVTVLLVTGVQGSKHVWSQTLSYKIKIELNKGGYKR